MRAGAGEPAEAFDAFLAGAAPRGGWSALLVVTLLVGLALAALVALTLLLSGVAPGLPGGTPVHDVLAFARTHLCGG